MYHHPKFFPSQTLTNGLENLYVGATLKQFQVNINSMANSAHYITSKSPIYGVKNVQLLESKWITISTSQALCLRVGKPSYVPKADR